MPTRPREPEGDEWARRRALALQFLSGTAYAFSQGEREDLAHEALIDLFERCRAGTPANPDGLLRRICERRAIDWLRSHRRRTSLFVEYDTERHESASAIMDVEGMLKLRILEALPVIAQSFFAKNDPKCMEHMRAYFSDGSWSDFAEAQDARLNTLIKQWQRCRDSFVVFIRARGLGWVLGAGDTDE
jgi:DNA-directed RNA polymerase specialized sigma24 family protein